MNVYLLSTLLFHPVLIQGTSPIDKSPPRIPPPPNCVDKVPNCQDFLALCENNELNRFMKEHCQKSCGHCEEGPTRSELKLWNAANDGNVDIVKEELASGANPNWQNPDYYQRGVLHTAVLNNNPTIVSLLLNAGADVDIKDYWGQTPLYLGSGQWSDEEILKSLIDAGADVDVEEATNTPLIIATHNNNFNAVKLLIHRNADINLVTVYGFTALNMAASRKFTDIALFLLENGADPLLLNNSGKTAADIAREEGLDELAQTIESYIV